MKQFRRKAKTVITAVQLNLETDGFTYKKWGGEQHCKAGDWLVNNDGDTYTVDAETFGKTYRELSAGVYEKHASVWAEQANAPGTVKTKEGATGYQAGDWLVYNDADRKDGYAMSASKFESLYEEY